MLRPACQNAELFRKAHEAISRLAHVSASQPSARFSLYQNTLAPCFVQIIYDHAWNIPAADQGA
jgi:hypothetical protein